MKKIVNTVLAVLLAFTFTIAQTKETRNVDTFTKISFRFPGKLYLKQGSEQKVVLEGRKEILEKIETKVSGNRLSIGREDEDWRFWRWNDEDRIVAYITVKDLEGISVSGSGDVIGESRFKTNNLSLTVSGSGTMELEADAGNLSADVSGSGDVNFSGTCRDFESRVSGAGKVTVNLSSATMADVSISGSGKIIAKGNAKEIKAQVSGSGEILAADLQVDRCDIRISGSGDVEVNVKSELDATISGSGTVSYRGNPGHVNSHASGSGKVRKM